MSPIKHLICIAFATFCSIFAIAIPAKPGLTKCTLPDGSTLNVRLVGDERAHYMLSEDNHVIIRDAGGYFVYANIDTQGLFVASTTRVSAPALRTDIEKDFVAKLDDGKIIKLLESVQRKRVNKAPRRLGWTSSYPTTGEQRGLIVLVQYKDVKFSVDDAQAKFNDMINKEGYTDNKGTGSARDWFIDNSCGQFRPSFDVYGPITLDNNRSYYGENNSSGDDMRAYEMAVEACQKLDEQIDFSIYDCNNDGYIDNVYLFYAGWGENLGGDATSETVWPHSDDIVNLTSSIYTFDKVRLNHYACSNELTLENEQEGIGTFVHEFSHVLGLPDLYATNYSYAFTPGKWSILDDGAYNNDGHTPPYYTAFERYSLGWLTPKEIGTAARHTLDEISTNQAYIITTQNENEFFLLENRQQNKWDSYVEGHGMLIWHIDYNEGVWNTNTVNNRKAHQYVDIEEADGIESSGTIGGDAFPGTANITLFTDDTEPNMRTWDGTAQNKPITNITESDGIIQFTISGGVAETATTIAVDATDVGITSFRANWQASSEDVDYLLSVYTTATMPSGKVITTYVDGFEKRNVGKETSYIVDGLSPQTRYNYSVVCYNADTDKESVASNVIEVTTLQPDFQLTAPQANAATQITDNGFTANWQAVDDADSYTLYVYTKQEYEPTVETVDFTNGIAGMPEGWDTSSNLTYSQTSYSGTAAPALRLAKSSAYIATAQYDDIINELTMWHRGVNAASTAYLDISAYANNSWVEVAQVPIVNTVGGTVTELSDNDIPNQSTALLVTYVTDGTGSVAIDDIKVTHGKYGNSIAVEAYNNINVGNVTSYTVNVPMSDGHYFYSVKALKGETSTLTSNEISVSYTAVVDDIYSGDNTTNIRANNGTIIVNTASSARVEIINLSGGVIARHNAVPGCNIFEAPRPGVYIVKVSNKAFKLLVK